MHTWERADEGNELRPEKWGRWKVGRAKEIEERKGVRKRYMGHVGWVGEEEEDEAGKVYVEGGA
jgi:hypothetical protein